MHNQDILSSSFAGFMEALMRPPAPSHELNAFRIAVLDPDMRSRKRVHRTIRRLGYVPVTFASADDFLQECRIPGPRFEALVLACPDDLAEVGALIVPLRARLGVDFPMVLLTGRRQVRELSVLHAGAADVVVGAPASLNGTYQLLASCLREHRMAVAEPMLEWGAYRFDLRSDTAEVAGDDIRLKPLEFDLAMELFRNIGRPLTRDWLYSTLWERGTQPNSRSLDVTLSGLRQKLRLRADQHGLELRSIRMQGYQLSVALRTF